MTGLQRALHQRTNPLPVRCCETHCAHAGCKTERCHTMVTSHFRQLATQAVSKAAARDARAPTPDRHIPRDTKSLLDITPPWITIANTASVSTLARLNSLWTYFVRAVLENSAPGMGIASIPGFPRGPPSNVTIDSQSPRTPRISGATAAHPGAASKTRGEQHERDGA